jgi:hypothetical protein
MSDSLLNRTQVRDFAFEMVKSKRPGLVGKMERVGDSFFEGIEAKLRMRIHADVRARTKIDCEAKTLRPAEIPVRDAQLPWLVTQTALRSFIAAAMDGSGLTLIGSDYVEACDLFLRRAIASYIEAMPSRGRTIS